MPGFTNLLSLVLFAGLSPASANIPAISDGEALRVGRFIWRNESRGTIEGLTSWNEGEEFASLGIAHFIWFPEGYDGPFRESFPLLVDYLQSQGVAVPEWLLLSPDCPWKSREEFLAARESPRMRELRALLASTVQWQARFTAERLRSSLPKLLTAAPAHKRAHVGRQFERVMSQPGGVYALVDYVNFKGEGILPKERYGGTGWGLLQVLERMRGSASGPRALWEFAASARAVLARRVRFSPPERREARWLKGWRARLRTYRSA
ncbi:MAG: hypothetical protein HY922_06950 [Elusimicrobia bacterium]|nr:hypothetical protein [Elusimicrobiota bacterium]